MKTANNLKMHTQPKLGETLGKKLCIRLSKGLHEKGKCKQIFEKKKKILPVNPHLLHYLDII